MVTLREPPKIRAHPDERRKVYPINVRQNPLSILLTGFMMEGKNQAQMKNLIIGLFKSKVNKVFKKGTNVCKLYKRKDCHLIGSVSV
jgi:hypothetical protein